MVSETFNGTTQWTVPQDVYTVKFAVWGAQGAGGGSGNTSGGLGGYAEGFIDVQPGDTFHLICGNQPSGRSGGYPNGGQGGQASSYQGSATAGGGGGSTDVRFPNDTQSDTILSAGGGGGGGEADSAPAEYSSTDRTNGGDGGADGQDANDGEAGDGSIVFASANGGHGGESGEWYGGGGNSAEADGEAFGAGGGGGGGHNGGSGGGADAYESEAHGDDWDHHAVGTGGGGGDGLTSGVYGSFSNTGVKEGDGQIEVIYTVTQPQSFNVSFDATVPETNLTWSLPGGFDNSRYDFNIYRGESPGVTTSSTQIAQVDGSDRSYTDTNVTRGETYYYIVATEDISSGSESTPSDEDGVLLAAQVNTYENGDWESYPVKIWDEDASEWFFPPSVKRWDEGDSTWYIESNR